MSINLRDLPSITKLMEHPLGKSLIDKYGRQELIEGCRTLLDSIRKNHESYENHENSITQEWVLEKVENGLAQKAQLGLKQVINCTGTILHTNLGRAPIPKVVAEKIIAVSTNYSNLEFNLEEGERGSRTSGIENQLKILLDVEDCAIVNNNAAAVVLVLMALTKGKEVIISRGQLVEIGGSFRVPEIMEQSGSILKEIGTTNKVHLRDYEKAIGENTGAIMRVHPSNYRVVGFTQEVSLKDLSTLAKKNTIPLIDDLGSGTLIPLGKWGIHDEPTAKESVDMGADVVTFSGDKLLGGPQCGIIIGKKEYVSKIKKHPLMRALRCDKLVLSALEYTLDLYKKELVTEIPLYNFLSRSQEELHNIAKTITEDLDSNNYEILEDYSFVGGGALPNHKIPTVIIKLKVDKSAQDLASWFRKQNIPVVGRIRDDEFILDIKAVFSEDIPYLKSTLKRLWG